MILEMLNQRWMFKSSKYKNLWNFSLSTFSCFTNGFFSLYCSITLHYLSIYLSIKERNCLLNQYLGCMPFSRALSRTESQTASSRIRTHLVLFSFVCCAHIFKLGTSIIAQQRHRSTSFPWRKGKQGALPFFWITQTSWLILQSFF